MPPNGDEDLRPMIARDRRFPVEEWLGQQLRAVLKANSRVLEHWSRQKLSSSERVKNFENWLLVQLVDRLWEEGACRAVKTNGYLVEPKLSAKPDRGAHGNLKGRKKDSASIAADLSVELREPSYFLNVEIKTQTAPQPILDDLQIVAHQNLHDEHLRNFACFAWVVLMPSEMKLRERVSGEIERIVKRAKKDVACELRPLGLPGHPRIVYAVAAPGLRSGRAV